jgi:hypothetical protein
LCGGYLLYLIAVLELEKKLFLDIGAADGINSNCANLALNLYWHGLSIDGNSANVERGLVIETHVEFGMRNIAVPYDQDYRYPGKHLDYYGASAPAMCSLAAQKGYRPVGANRYGFNLIFVHNHIYPDRVPAVPLESVLRHSRRPKEALVSAIRYAPSSCYFVGCLATGFYCAMLKPIQ